MDSSRARSGRIRLITIFTLIGVLAWVALPVLALVLLFQRSAQIKASEEVPVWVQVESNSDATDTPVGVQLFWSESPAMVAPAWTGLVQEVLVTPGETIKSGSPIATVDGVRRLAVHTPRPFAQTISYGQRGSHVTMLTVMLHSLGYDVSESNVYGPQVTQAVKKLATDIGVDSPDGTLFDPGWVVYLAGSELSASSVDLTVAAPAPAPGTPIVTASPRLSRALLTQADAVKELLGAESPAPVARNTLIVAAAGQTLILGGAEASLDPDQPEVPDAALDAIEKQVQPLVNAVQANIRTRSDPSAMVIPSAAVFASASGKICVATDRPGHGNVEVTVLSQGGGRTVVFGNLRVSDRVQISPNAEERSCK